ncbi:hypothetical protein PC118_g3203 [Phytophthora cactorum]|uniref:YHYH domain-containing protein n=2 Tax=Phytophthora cactorum TaxID=29920 RepID=A0A8T1GI81_9STRA|nr:hypothetical protein PC118_g3203 [Phytophthora cactorum]
MESLLALQLYLVTFLLFLSPTNPIEPVPQAADADTVVNAGTSKSIRLDANLLIPDGGELLLNIQVPHEPIQIRPKGPAKVLRVYSDHVDGKFGVGEVINIFVKFTSPVKLSGSGSPYLVLKTGCHASSCHIKEIQRLRCMATKGKFAVGFGSQKVGNIPWDASAKVFAAYLKRMNRINKVSVKYSIDEDRACTFFGNNITVTFESMNIAGTDGDLVEMTGDATNAVGDGIVLGHVMYSPLVTPTAWEIRKGVLVPDRKALFVAQTAPDTLKFGYTVQKGDNTTALEYANSDSLALSLRAITGVRIVNDDGAYTIANTILPPPGFDGDWERGIGTSLSKNSALEIDVTPPFVKTVTSPHDDGTFGIGEEILVHVYFSQPIEVTGLPTVVLETGAVDRIIPFNQVVAGNIAEFKYIVQSMDTSPDLTYTGTTALQLNGGSIKRKSTTPTTNAVLKLPVNGETGSLSVNKNMVIDTTKPKILSVTTTAKDGVYTAGDDIPVIVTFDMPVVVTGAPQLLLSTGSVDLFPGQFVLEAPKFTSNETVVFPSYYLGLSTISSKGLQFKIDGQILTVDSVLRDEVTMIEKYTGTKVDPAALSLRANVPIYTPGYRPAKYSSGSGTKMLTFMYTVQIGDISTRLAYISTSALQLGSGSVKRLSTTPFTNADLTLAAPGTSGSLSASAVLVINTGAPRVTQVKAITRDGVYKAGDEIYFEVIFNLPVVVSPVASLLTNIASAGVERLAVSSEGSGTTSLKFKFDCQEDDQATVLDVKNVNSLRTAYGSILGWIRRKSAAPMLPAVLDLPLAGLISKGISINQGCEVVTDVSTSHEEGTYGVGESIDILVKYSASVSVDITGGVPTLVTTTGNRAVYQYGTGTKTLVFNYVVQQSDISGQVFYPDRFSLKTNGAVIKGLTSSALSSTLLPLPELSQLKIMDNLFVEILPPVVKEVSTRTQDQVITIGDTIVVFVSFNYPIYVPPLSVGAGAPTLLLNVGTGNGIASSYVAAEDFAVYFSFTVAAGQSTSKLSYFGRSALKCTGGNGLNKDPGQNAGPPTAVLFGDLFVTSWAEMSSTTNTRQIRVKSFDLQQFPPLSSFEDGGGVSSTVNFDSTMDASSPELVTFSSKLYLVWVEASTATNNPPQIRVAVLASRSNLNSPAQWTFVDAKPATNSGINKLSTANAGGPRAVVHKSKLYVAWNENPSGVAQIRVAVFNGVDIAPGWTFIDGNQNARGLNYAASQPAQNVRLCSCGSKGSTAKNLYAAWSEISTLSGTAQIRVAVQTGPDSLPNWKFIDGNAVTGLNIDTQKIAKSPSIQCTGGSSVVIGWQETTGISGSVIFIKIFNGDFTTPQWTRLDGGKGLNFDTTQPAQNLKLSIQMLGTTETLFATWDEMDSTGTATQIRVAKLLTGTTSWRFLDGGAKLSAINDDVSHATSRPILALRQSQDTVITAWLETHSNGRSHIRGSVLESSVKEWQPISQGCILRKSTTSVKSANLILPELNSPGSLDFGNSVRVETSKPTVQNVSLAGDIYSSITSVNTIQTIDVFNVASIKQGEYKLIYGNTMETSCISWNAPATGTGSIQSALQSTTGMALQVSVTQDTTAFHDGYRYTITFIFPSMGILPLQVKTAPDAKCLKFKCDPASTRFSCNLGLIQPNQNSDIRTAAGVVDAVVRFSFPVVIPTGIPKLITRAESESISFRYVAQSSDEATSLTYKSSSSLTGTILRSSMNPILTASLTLPPPTALVAQDGVTSMAVVRSDKIPVVSRVYSSTNDDTYTAGDVIIVLVEFSEKVLVVGKPILELNSKGEALYISGSGTNVLKFYYEIQSGEASADLNYASEAALRTFTFPISKITCALCSGSGIDADTTLPALASATSLAGNNALVVDTTIPIVALISSSRADTAIGDIGYGPGDIVDIIVTFSTVVSVTGTPSLTLNSGGKAKFTYAGYRQLVDIGVNAVVPVTSGQFAIVYDGEISGCIDFDDASSTAATSLKSRLLEFKAIARIGILSVTMTKKKNGNRFEVLFDSTKVVDVPLSIELAISDMCDPLQPSSAAQETLISRTTDNQIVFHYSVGVGDTAAVLNVVSTSITLNPGTASILRQSGSPVIVANVALPASTSPQNLAQTKTLKIDGTPATISDIISDSAVGTYGVGFPTVASPLTVAPGEILFHLGFTRPVAVIGIPTVELATGSLRPSGEFIPNRFAKFVNQPQPNQVAFLYHIEPDDYSTNLAFPSVNVLSGANIYCVSSTMSVRASLILPKLTISNGIIKIDAYSVPAAVKLASSHKDGVYGAGELIEIQVSFSKQIVLLSGLNRNQDWHARYPVALEFKRDIYIMWTERDDMHAPTKSFLYLRVFSSDTLDVVPITSVSAINRVPNTFIEKVAMTVWKQNLYAAWDEGGLLYCALFEGIPSINPWTLIPNMGINKNMAMAASDPVLLVYNLELVVVWREKALPVGSSALVGQIRVAVFNYETDAPLWIFHDGNQLDSGLNKNKLMDADDPVAVVYRGRMYVSWTEMNSDGAYEIVIARRNIQTRDFSTWTYLDALPSTYPAYSFLSAYKPQFAVRRRGIEDMSLLVSWYRDTVTSNVSEVITGQVLDLDWEASVTGSIPQTINAAEASTTVNNVNPNSIEQKFVTCGDNIYSSWLDLEGNNDDAAYVVKLATLPSGADVYTGWTQAVNQSNMNHNPKRDVMDSFLVCSTSSTVNSLPGLVWTEYDGYSIKLRFRHYALVPRTPGATSTTYGETIAGAPVLMLATQSNPLGYATCIDKSGLTTTMLSFTYMVQPGESSPQLEILGQDALKLNGAVIRDISGKDPDFTLFPDSANLRSLSYNSKLAISTTPPTVISVTSTNPSGEYGVGQVLEIQVTFSGPVVVVKGDPASPPTLSLRSDELHLLTSSQGIATYAGGSGSSVLTFEYTTVQQDYCEQLDYMDTASLALNGSTWAIKRNATRPTTDAVLTLPPVRTANSLSGSRTIVIKPTQPSVVKVTSSTPDGTYYPGDIILVDVIFSLPVVVFGFPVLLLKTGGDTATRAFLKSGNGTVKLTFEYDIKIGDKSARLDVVDDRIGDDQAYFVMSLLLEGYAEIKRASTNPFTIAVTALPAPGLSGSLSFSKIIIVDSTPPTVIDIRSAAVDGTYDIGEQVDVSLIFSHAVVVTGIPEIILNVPSEYSRTAVYTDGSGTNILRFSYFPKEGDNSRNLALDILDENSLILRPLLRGKELLQNPAEILCRSSNPVLRADIKLPIPGVAVRSDAVLSLVGNNRKIFVRTDGFRVKAIQSDVPSGIYSPGQRIVLSVVFTGPTVVQGSPRLKLNSNTAAYAVYIGGTGTSKLRFEYIVATGDSCTVLEAASRSALELNGGVISDSDGIYVPLRLGIPTKPGSLSANYKIEITSTPPSVQRVYCKDGDGSYGVGDNLYVAIVFSRKITLSNPLPSLLLRFDVGTRAATYFSGDKTDTLEFTLQIANGDFSSLLDYASKNALTGTIFALSTTPTTAANLELPIPGNDGSLADSTPIRVISTPPVVVDVRAVSRAGNYGLYDKIRLQIRFSFPVYVSPSASQSCTVTLAVGDVEFRKAIYIGGSTTTKLEFEYVIQYGDHSSRLDYIGANSLQCTILQSTAVPSLQASNTLRLPGALGSLSFNSALRIDALSPRITSVSSGSANGVYGAGQVIDIAITFSEAILVPSGATPRLMLAIASNTAVNALLGISSEPYATYTGGSGTNILQFAYSVRVGDMALPLEYAGIDALSLTIQSAQLTAVGKKYRYASMRLPVPGATGSLSNNRDIHIDTLEPPRVISVGSLMADGIYTAGDTLTISVTFSTPVIVSGSPPMLLLNTGNPDTSNTDKKAVYVSGSGSSVLLFAYKVHIGDNVDRLEYKPCPVAERSAFIQRKWDKLVRCSSTSNALQLGGISSSIKRSSTVPVTDAVLDLPEVNDWAELRVVTTDGDVVYVTQIEPTTGTEKNELPILENEFSISHQRAAINIYSNGLPSHDTNLYEKIKEQKYFIELQRFPTLQSQALNLSRIADAFSGVFLNGVLFKNSNKSAKSTDECGGAIDADGHYFYVNLPTCFLAAIHEPREAVVSLTGQITRPPSVIVAYALDGFPIYGYYDENGELPSDLDECHGHMRRDGQYAYHLVPPTTSASPFIPCLKGIASPSQLSVFRYPADISAIEGLSLSELTKFNSFVIDENPGIYQVDTWLNPDNVSVVYTSTSVIVRSNGVPSGSYGPFPNAYNRYSVYEQDYIFQFPRSPVSAATTTSLPRDIPIGVMVNGVPFFAANSDFYGGIVVDTKNPSYKLLDKCNGLVDTGGDYRYYASPDCLLHELGDKAGQPSPLIGFAFDGFPLYGPYGENGQTPNDLDACNGRVGEDGTYRYHVTLGAPYLLGCFRGNPSIDQKNLDAASDLYRSLSYAHALRINTDRPQITHVFTNKRPGVYVTGESVDVVVEWSTPVQVVGIPSLSIQNSSRVATYDASRSSKTQTVFLYLVKTDDVNLEDFSYDAHAAIQLNGGRIARFATIPVLDADLELTPSDLHDIALIRSRTSGISSKFQLVRDLRVVLRGLYHPRAQDLRARVFHGNRESIIFDGCCTTRDAFGVPDVPNVLTNRAQLASEARNPTSGVGWDYSFSDFEGVKNLALNGGATALQSSISGTCGPMNAIDGRIRGVSVSRQTVARTLPANDVKESSWWELRLVDVATIGTIRIWIADNDPSVPVDVFILRVNSSDGISAVTGDFTLTFTTQDNKQLETESVSHNAVAMIADEKARVTASGIGHGESIQAKLLALGDVVPRLLITREPRDAALSRNGAFTWHITFLDNPRAVLSVGVNNVCGGTGVVKIGAPLSIDDDSDPIVYRNEESSKPSAGTSVRDTEQSMFPFWVLLFDSSAVMDVESFADAYARAIFSYRVDERHTNRSVISVVPPLGTKAQYVRLVAELPRGVLSIAEVEVFTEQNHVLSQYAGGTPVRTAYHPGGKTWSPEEPFRYTFRGMPSEGSWTLAIMDMAVNGSNLAPPRPNSTAGGISDWVLYFTNQAGETVSYFMDFQAQLHALPRHGTLYVGLDETERDHLDIDGNGLLDSIEADAYLRRYSPNTYADLSANIRDRELKEFMLSYEEYGAVQVLRDASERQLRLPSSVCDAECLAAIKLDPYFYVGLEGDKALKLLRVIGERVVKYVPDAGFRGLDAFTFSVAVTGQESRVLGTIQLTVKECEDPECRMSSFLLHRSTR